MKPGPTRQPSNVTLCVTALACGATLCWALQERHTPTAQAARRPAPAVRFDEASIAILPAVAQPEPYAAYGAPALEGLDPAPWLEESDIGPIALPPLPEPAASPRPAPMPAPAASPGAALSPADLMTEEQSVLAAPIVESIDSAPIEPAAPAVAAQPATPIGQPRTREPVEESYEDDDAALVAETPRDDLMTYTPAASQISQRVAGDVRAAFELGQHGALHAARRKFIDVMAVIAAAKDIELSTDRHSRALAEGLRALDEAGDFLPGGALSQDLTVADVVASHQTPMLRGQDRAERTLPQEAAAMYYRFAEQKLATAVAGEQAGSMALYGLGKTHARLAELEKSTADQQLSLAMHRAALVAHHGNHLAANELGVGLASVGRYDKAAAALQQSIANGGGSTVYRNLAHVQQQLGEPRLAAQTTQHAERLAMQERAAGAFSRERGVQWVTPDQLARQSSGAGAPPMPAAQPTIAAAPTPAPSESPLSGVTRFARRILVGSPAPQPAPPQATPATPARPVAPIANNNRVAAPVRSQTSVR